MKNPIDLDSKGRLEEQNDSLPKKTRKSHRPTIAVGVVAALATISHIPQVRNFVKEAINSGMTPKPLVHYPVNVCDKEPPEIRFTSEKTEQSNDDNQQNHLATCVNEQLQAVQNGINLCMDLPSLIVIEGSPYYKADLFNDPRNCGGCGVECTEGHACIEARCQ